LKKTSWQSKWKWKFHPLRKLVKNNPTLLYSTENIKNAIKLS
jgi:hypothetical protein